MKQAEVQALFAKFAAPLAGYAATSALRREGADFLVRSLWTAMIAGPEMEEETWKVFRQHSDLDDDSLHSIKDVYFQEMRPAVTEQQLAALRVRYPLRRKQPPDVQSKKNGDDP